MTILRQIWTWHCNPRKFSHLDITATAKLVKKYTRFLFPIKLDRKWSSSQYYTFVCRHEKKIIFDFFWRKFRFQVLQTSREITEIPDASITKEKYIIRVSFHSVQNKKSAGYILYSAGWYSIGWQRNGNPYISENTLHCSRPR